jgi:predicted HTH transcriptional regulator
MPLSEKHPNEITEADLIGLIGTEPEGKTIDYKSNCVGQSDTDTDRKEFLYDVASFANTQGGYLVFGMEEAGGLPTNLVGIAGINPDKEKLRLEEMLRSGIRPTISGIEMAFVQLASGNVALVMHIPRSWTPPHQVTYGHLEKYSLEAGRSAIEVAAVSV